MQTLEQEFCLRDISSDDLEATLLGLGEVRG